MPDHKPGLIKMKELLLLLCRYPFDEKDSDTISKLISAVRDWREMMAILTNGYLQNGAQCRKLEIKE